MPCDHRVAGVTGEVLFRGCAPRDVEGVEFTHEIFVVGPTDWQGTDFVGVDNHVDPTGESCPIFGREVGAARERQQVIPTICPSVSAGGVFEGFEAGGELLDGFVAVSEHAMKIEDVAHGLADLVGVDDVAGEAA